MCSLFKIEKTTNVNNLSMSETNTPEENLIASLARMQGVPTVNVTVLKNIVASMKILIQSEIDKNGASKEAFTELKKSVESVSEQNKKCMEDFNAIMDSLKNDEEANESAEEEESESAEDEPAEEEPPKQKPVDYVQDQIDASERFHFQILTYMLPVFIAVAIAVMANLILYPFPTM